MRVEFTNIICAVIDIIALIFYCNTFFDKHKMSNWLYYIFIAIIVSLNVGKLFLNVSSGFNLILSFILHMSTAFVIYKTTIKNRIFAVSLFIVLIMLSDLTAQYLLEKVLNISYNDVELYNQVVFAPLSSAITMLILFYIRKTYRKQLVNIPFRYLMPIMTVPIAILVIILIEYKIIVSSNSGGEGLIVVTVMLLLYVCFIMLDYFENYSDKIRLDAALEIIKKDKENYSILERNEEELRILKHDIRKHMQTIQAIKNTVNNDVIDTYVNDLQKTVDKINSVSYTGNTVIDSILNINGRRASVLNIRYFVKSNIMADIKISDMDMSAILTNALDNALDGTQKSDEPSIVIYIETDKNMVRLLIENTASNVIIEEDGIKTTKRDKKNHGKGIKSIISCVEKYDGNVRFDYDGGIFVFEAILPNKLNI